MTGIQLRSTLTLCYYTGQRNGFVFGIVLGFVLSSITTSQTLNLDQERSYRSYFKFRPPKADCVTKCSLND